jgi:hypothetical protein
MPRKPTRKPHDFAQVAFRVVRIATGEEPNAPEKPEKNPKRVEAGRKGGEAKKKAIPKRRRVEIATKAARYRWGK